VRKHEKAQNRSRTQTPSFSTGTTASTAETAEASQCWSSPGNGSTQAPVLNSFASPDPRSQPHSPIPTTDSGGLRSLRRHLGPIWYFKGMQLLSPMGWEWMSSKTGQTVRLDRLFSSSDPLLSKLDSRDELPELPDKPTTRKVLDAFRPSSSLFTIPIFDSATFEDTLHRACMTPDRPPSSQAQSSAKACIWSFHALASLHQRVRKLPISVDGEACAGKVQSLLGYLIGESSLESLQAILMLQTYRAATGQWQCSDLLSSLACRMVCDLAGHTQQLIEQTHRGEASADSQRHRRRMAFWWCYALDKDGSLRSGQPPILVGDYYDLTLPDVCTGSGGGPSATAVESEDFACCVSLDPSLSILKERIFHLLYTPRASEIHDRQLVLNMRHLDDELEQWRLSIPAEMRPRLSVSSAQPLVAPGTGCSREGERVKLQLEHLYILTAIHAAVRRAGATIGEGERLPDDLHSVIHSSVDITLEAGRSTLLCLEASMERLQEDAFQ